MKFIIGIAGQTGSGKSELARHLSKEYNALHIEVDTLGHEVLRDDLVVERLVKVFGAGILDSSGRIDRKTLGHLVFADVKNREMLNEIMHPVMCAKVSDMIDSNTGTLAIINAALLFTMRLDKMCDEIIYVSARPDIRLNRLVKDRGLSLTQAEVRLFSQDTLPENNNSLIIIENNGAKASFFRNAENFLSKYVSKNVSKIAG